MAVITFLKSGKTVHVPNQSNLMQSLLDAGMPVASSCGGDGVCGKCHVKIIKGQENLSEETQEERELKEIHDVPKTDRISCQTKILGDVVLDTTYW
jgi:2Fe-2S ferredoxin